MRFVKIPRDLFLVQSIGSAPGFEMRTGPPSCRTPTARGLKRQCRAQDVTFGENLFLSCSGPCLGVERHVTHFYNHMRGIKLNVN